MENLKNNQNIFKRVFVKRLSWHFSLESTREKNVNLIPCFLLSFSIAELLTCDILDCFLNFDWTLFIIGFMFNWESMSCWRRVSNTKDYFSKNITKNSISLHGEPEYIHTKSNTTSNQTKKSCEADHRNKKQLKAIGCGKATRLELFMVKLLQIIADCVFNSSNQRKYKDYCHEKIDICLSRGKDLYCA